MRKKNTKAVSWVLFLISEVLALSIIICLILFGGHIHGMITVVTMIILNGHGMVIFRLFPGLKTVFVKYIHTVIEFAVLLGGILGTVLIITDNDDGFYLHPYLGLFTLVLIVIQLIVSAFVYLYMYSSQRRRKLFAGFHNFLGILILQLSIISASIQLQDSINGNTNADMAVICMVLYGVIINSIVLNPYTEWPLVGPL